jgi:hypothetical protein
VRCGTPVVAAVMVAVVAAIAQPAAAVAKPSACQRLKGRDLAPARSVKLIARPHPEYGSDLVGCVLPRGPVRKLATIRYGDNDDGKTHFSLDYDIEQVIGRIVVLRVSDFDSYGGTVTTEVRDLRGGGGYTVASTCIPTFYTGPCENDTPHLAALRVSLAGRAAAILTGGPTGQTLVRAFDSLGRGRTLDGGPGADIPAASLQLAGNVISWTNAGVARSADLRTGG